MSPSRKLLRPRAARSAGFNGIGRHIRVALLQAEVQRQAEALQAADKPPQSLADMHRAFPMLTALLQTAETHLARTRRPSAAFKFFERPYTVELDVDGSRLVYAAPTMRLVVRLPGEWLQADQEAAAG